jgi:hypothetical protein
MRTCPAAQNDGQPRPQPQMALIDCDLPVEELARAFPHFKSYLERSQAVPCPEN